MHKDQGIESGSHPQADIAAGKIPPLSTDPCTVPVPLHSPNYPTGRRGNFAGQGFHPGRVTLSPRHCWCLRRGQRECLLPAPLRSAPRCLFFSQGWLHRNKLAPSFTLTHLLCLPLKNEEFVAGFSSPATLCAGGQQQWPQSAAQINGPKHDTRELPRIKEFLRRGFIFPLEPQSLVIWSKHKGCPEFPVSFSLLAAGELGDALGHLVPFASTSAHQAVMVAGHPAPPPRHSRATGLRCSLRFQFWGW